MNNGALIDIQPWWVCVLVWLACVFSPVLFLTTVAILSKGRLSRSGYEWCGPPLPPPITLFQMRQAFVEHIGIVWIRGSSLTWNRESFPSAIAHGRE